MSGAKSAQAPQRPWVGAITLLTVAVTASWGFYYQFVLLPASSVEYGTRDVSVDLVMFQWGFMANGTIIGSDRPLDLRVGDNVTFRIKSTFERDSLFLAHGFFIQVLMQDQGPVAVLFGKDVTVNIRFDKPGEWVLICTIFCGVGHGDMKAIIRIS